MIKWNIKSVNFHFSVFLPNSSRAGIFITPIIFIIRFFAPGRKLKLYKNGLRATHHNLREWVSHLRVRLIRTLPLLVLISIERQCCQPTTTKKINKKKCRDPLSSGDKWNLRLKTGSQDVFTAKKKLTGCAKKRKKIAQPSGWKSPRGQHSFDNEIWFMAHGEPAGLSSERVFLCANLCQSTGFMIERCPISCDKTWSDLWQRARDYAFSQIWPNFGGSLA